MRAKSCLAVAIAFLCAATLGCTDQADSSNATSRSTSPSDSIADSSTTDTATPESPATGRDRSSAAASSAQESALAGASQVKLEIRDYDGILDLIKSHRGKVVVMDAWSTWCPPCVEEFPGLVRLHKKYGPAKVACISLSLDFDGIGDDTPDAHVNDVLDFLQKQGASFDNVLNGEPSEDMYHKFKFPSPPTVFVYDQQGNLAKRFENRKPNVPKYTYEDIDKFVAELLEGRT